MTQFTDAYMRHKGKTGLVKLYLRAHGLYQIGNVFLFRNIAITATASTKWNIDMILKSIEMPSS